ncbi:MAG: hypothetical protein FKGGLIKP_00870 [Sodalis sp. Fse]|nr:MAG: hypothetical protein FKGGLIKP_00870 [Sodalis sp. Fse]
MADWRAFKSNWWHSLISFLAKHYFVTYNEGEITNLHSKISLCKVNRDLKLLIR